MNEYTIKSRDVAQRLGVKIRTVQNHANRLRAAGEKCGYMIDVNRILYSEADVKRIEQEIAYNCVGTRRGSEGEDSAA